jgi:hypothetical protein
MNRLFGVLGVVAAIGALGCGGDNASAGPPARAGTVNRTGAKSVLMQTVAMQAALEAHDGASLSGQVNSVAISGAQQMVSPAAVVKALTVLSQAQTATGTSGTVNCDSAGCTYDKFMVSGFTYNGSITSADAGGGAKKVTANLTMKGSIASGGPSQTIDWTITGNTTISATSVDGFFQSTGSGTLSGLNTPGAPSSISYTYFNQVKYQAVALASGNATGGSMYGKWGITVANVAGASQAWDGTVTFP